MDKFVTRTRKRTMEDGGKDLHSKRRKTSLTETEKGEEGKSPGGEFPRPIPWRKIEADGLDCDYGLLFSREEADGLYSSLEQEVEYFSGDQAKVRVFGKLHSVPRQQATYGDEGLMYSFSGVHLLARPWTQTLAYIRDAVTKATGHTFNFVLINRYRDGLDHIGEHRDDERELDPLGPIASVSLGATRPFVFRHRDARGKAPGRRKLEPVRLELAHGSLLLMNAPTNTYWYHSLPVRKGVLTARVNLTFRRVLRDRRRGGQIVISATGPHSVTQETFSTGTPVPPKMI
ncbi:DNA oxidative demethylase ALKBH2 [Denticeps clupeoides]|uniref:DNA oxidative demethylase ALKBH2 n=1 Tax=Denticeps clupeoides TaxID=299321 RepID=A0AAY4D232_9TELE|nr:DNA oxidative demethylase ALKBH2 [Denticeps clupeoides]